MQLSPVPYCTKAAVFINIPSAEVYFDCARDFFLFFLGEIFFFATSRSSLSTWRNDKLSLITLLEAPVNPPFRFGRRRSFERD